MQKINIDAFMSHMFMNVIFRAYDEDFIKVQVVHGERLENLPKYCKYRVGAWRTTFKVTFSDALLGEGSEYSIYFNEINDDGECTIDFGEYSSTVKVKNIDLVDRYGHSEVLRAEDSTTTVQPLPDVEYSLLEGWSCWYWAIDGDVCELFEAALKRYVEVYNDEQYARDQAHDREVLGLNMSPDSEPVPVPVPA